MLPKIILVSALVTLCSFHVAGDENYICSQAIRIVADGDAVDGTNHSNPDTSDYVDAGCAFGTEDEVGGSAWWYIISGNGGVIQADTCSNVTNFDTVISIYRGDCENLKCVGSVDDGGCGSSLSSAVEWETEESVDYYIRVYGFSGGSGDFRLKTRSLEPLMNDFCDGAIALTDATEFPIIGISNNSFPDNITVGETNFVYDTGVWYSFQGTGGGLSVSACSDEYNLPNMYIFSGACDELESVASSVNVSGVCEQSTQSGSQAIFVTEVNTEYFILVTQYGYGSNSEFELTMSDVEIPPNAFCSGATELFPDVDNITGSLANATTVTPSLPCSDDPGNRGVWYSLMGTGDVFIISTCSVELSFDSAISVSRGTCDNRECVEFGVYNDWNCGLSDNFYSAKVVFKSEIGAQYQVMVEQVGEGIGDDFGLTVTSVKVPPNIVCTNPIVVQPDNGTITGWINNVTGVMDDSFTNPEETVGAWFSLVGTGAEYEITTCSSRLNFDSALRILTGTCDDLRLIIAVADNEYDCNQTPYEAARVVLLTEPGVVYHILVETLSELPDTGGDYDLTISTVEVRPAYVCSGAEIIQPNNNGAIQGSLSDAIKFSDMNYACTRSVGAPSAWYALQGTGGIYAISTCSTQLNFDSVISVSTGSCKDQQCTMFNSSIDLDCSDSDYVASRVVVSTEIGVEYWIAIQGLSLNNSSQGQFGLTISSVLPSPDDIRDNDGLDFLSRDVDNHNVSQSPEPNSAPTGGGISSDSLRIGPGRSSESQEIPPKSGLDRPDLLPSIVVTISIAILPFMMNQWLV